MLVDSRDEPRLKLPDLIATQVERHRLKKSARGLKISKGIAID